MKSVSHAVLVFQFSTLLISHHTPQTYIFISYTLGLEDPLKFIQITEKRVLTSAKSEPYNLKIPWKLVTDVRESENIYALRIQ